MTEPNSKKPRFPPIAARVDMINGNFELPEGTVEAMREARFVVAQAAQQLEAIFQATEHDRGRAIHSIDLLQQVKNVACDALILPHHKEVADDE